MNEKVQKEQGKLNKKLFDAIDKNNLSAVKATVELGADVNSADKDGWPPLCLSMDSDIEIPEYLLHSKANPNIQNINGDTPMHIAVRFIFIDKFFLLLQNNADMYIKNNAGRTPFAEIFNWKNLEAVKLALADVFVLNGYIPTEEDLKNINNESRTETKAHFMELVRQVQSHKAKLTEAADTDQEVQCELQCCDECFDF